jgi:hypothetical protein
METSEHLHEEPAVAVSRLDAALHPPPQNDHLMSEHRILRLKPALQLERRRQNGQNETDRRDHSAGLGDSITSSTRMGFSVHTGVGPERPGLPAIAAAVLRSALAPSSQADCGRERRERLTAPPE